MKGTQAGILALAVALAGSAARAGGPQGQAGDLSAYRAAVEASVLHNKAQAAGGKLQLTRRADPEKLFPDLASLAAESDEVLEVKILANHSGVSPARDFPITIYHASVLRIFKTAGSSNIVYFSVPFGLVTFTDGCQAAALAQGFDPPLNGKTYLVFLRIARGAERGLTPGLRLTGDALQGAFEVRDGLVYPSYRSDALFAQYQGTPATQFFDEIVALLPAKP